MKNILFLIICLFTLYPSKAQNIYSGNLDFTDYSIRKLDNMMDIRFTIVLNNIHLSSDKMIMLIPSLINEEGDKLLNIDTIIIAGKTRAKYIERFFTLNNKIANKPEHIYVRNNGHDQKIEIYKLVEFDDRYYNSSLIVDESVSGCAKCDMLENRYMIESEVLTPSPLPNFNLSFIISDIQYEKRISKELDAKLSFKLNQSDISKDFANNRHELTVVDSLISEINADKEYAIEFINITGYASPEGYVTNNLHLSKNRAKAFANYLTEKYKLDRNKILARGKGEDWTGLRNLILKSDLKSKHEIINIIDNTPDADARKNKIKVLVGNKVYEKLLKQYYPLLRRNTYCFRYTESPTSIEDIKNKLKTDPGSLSLNSILIAAKSYDQDSAEAQKAYSIAASLSPKDEIPNLNISAYEIETGNTDQAINRLKVFNTAETLNNLGVAYLLKGLYQDGEESLTKSAEAGSINGKTNLNLYKSWKKKNRIKSEND